MWVHLTKRVIIRMLLQSISFLRKYFIQVIFLFFKDFFVEGLGNLKVTWVLKVLFFEKARFNNKMILVRHPFWCDLLFCLLFLQVLFSLICYYGLKLGHFNSIEPLSFWSILRLNILPIRNNFLSQFWPRRFFTFESCKIKHSVSQIILRFYDVFLYFLSHRYFQQRKRLRHNIFLRQEFFYFIFYVLIDFLGFILLHLNLLDLKNGGVGGSVERCSFHYHVGRNTPNFSKTLPISLSRPVMSPLILIL